MDEPITYEQCAWFAVGLMEELPSRDIHSMRELEIKSLTHSQKIDKAIRKYLKSILDFQECPSHFDAEIISHIYIRLRFARDWFLALSLEYPEWHGSLGLFYDLFESTLVSTWRIHGASWLLLALDLPAFHPIGDDLLRALYLASQMDKIKREPGS